MSIFDFLFPEQSAAMQLRRIADQKEHEHRFAAIRRRQDERRRKLEFAAEKAMPSQAAISDDHDLVARLDQLEEELHRANLIIAALIASLEGKGAVNREEIRSAMSKLDNADGRQDGGLNGATLKSQFEN